MSEATRKILILGGYGVFGGRLAQLLADEPRVTLILAGRSLEKARAFCASLPGGAPRIALAFDRDGDVGAQLASIRPDLIVDASGPFQAYSGDIYKLVRAAIALGADYMDLADSSEFVAGIGAFDAEARARGVYVLAGVSSFPVLTAAVVRKLAGGFGACRGDPRRHRAFAVRARRPQCHPRDRQLCRPEGGADARRRGRASLWIDRDDAARRAPAGHAAVGEPALLARRRSRSARPAAALAGPEFDLDRRGARAGNPPSRADRSGLARASAALAESRAAGAIVSCGPRQVALGRASRRHVCRDRRDGR